jgi:phage baseplate assembly protein W
MPYIDDPTSDYREFNRESMIMNHSGYQVKEHSFCEDIGLDTVKKATVTDIDCINQAISNILLTMPGERFFNLHFGTNIYKYLFENFDTVSDISFEIYSAIKKYEQRIDLGRDDIDVSIDQEEQYIEVTVNYLVKETNIIGEWSDKLYA